MITTGKYLGIALGIAIILLAYAEHLEPAAYMLIALAYIAGAGWATIMSHVARTEE